MKQFRLYVLSSSLIAMFLFFALASSEEKPAASKVTIIQHSIKQQQITGAYYVYCQVKNSTEDLLSYVEINVTFFDKDKKIVGKAMGNTNNLAANAERTLEAIGIGVENVATYEVEVSQAISL